LQTARDSVLLAIFAFGEGYHNYHHQFASDYRNGIRWYQWDPTKWLIRGLSLVGLTSRLKEIPATEIQKARLRTEERSLLKSGFPVERIEVLKQKRELAQARIKEIREEYMRLKADMKIQGQQRYEVMKAQGAERYLMMKAQYQERYRILKADLKASRLERKLAMRQWSLYLRAWRNMPSMGR
jgi:stearoyl-CoA desaturase (Delta-9 desaturase)